MVKKVDLQTFISGCTAQNFYEKVYAKAEAMNTYHEMVNKDPAAEVTAWDNGVRTVSFCMPLNAPDFVKKMIGVDAVKVAERQSIVWHSHLHFTITSETSVLNIPGANKFTTSLFLSVVEDEQQQQAAAVAAAAAAAAAVPAKGQMGAAETEQLVAGATAAGVAAATGVSVRFSVKCSAGLPWPMQASIENIMADRAQESMAGYLDFCCRLVDEALAPRARGLHRWPTAIAGTMSAFDAEMERPLLLGGEEFGTEGDMPEVFYSPRNASESSTPSVWDSRQAPAVSMADALDRAALSRRGSLMQPALAPDAWASALAQRSTRESIQVSDLVQVVVVLQGLHQAVQKLDDNISTLRRDVEARYSWRSSLKVLALLMLTLGAIAGLLYLHFWHRTGLMPQPPELGKFLAPEPL